MCAIFRSMAQQEATPADNVITEENTSIPIGTPVTLSTSTQPGANATLDVTNTKDSPGVAVPIDVTEVKPKWFWVTDASGNGSVTATFALVAFYATTFAYISSIFISVGPVKFHTFDVAACGAYLGPVLTLYVTRKWVSSKYDNQAPR